MATRLTKKIEDEIVSRTRDAISEGIDHCEAKHTRWEENQQYTRGLQWSKDDIAKQERRSRPAVPLNDTFKVVHAISNREMVSRLVPKVFGRDKSDEGVAEVLDEACRWQRQMASSEQVESMAFRSATMCGYGVAHKYWDPVAQNGDGQVSDEDVPLCEMLWPARARMMNLSDRRWTLRGKWVPVDEADELYGGASRKIRRMLRSKSALARSDAPSTDTSDMGSGERPAAGAGFGWMQAKSSQFINTATREVFVVEHEWLETEYLWRVAFPRRFYEWSAFIEAQVPLTVQLQNPETGEPVEQPIEYEQYAGADEAQKDAFRDSILTDSVEVLMTAAELHEFEDQYENVVGDEFQLSVKTARRTVKFAVLVSEKVADYGERPYGFSYHFITGFPFETGDGMDFYGTVDLTKGAQDYKNAFASTMLASYMAGPKGGLLIEKGAVPNVNEFLDQYASPVGVLIVNDGTIQNPRFQALPAPHQALVPPELTAMMANGVTTTLGLSSIDIAAQDDLRRVSGKVVQAAQLAGNVIVAILFDSMRKFRREYGLCNLKFLRFMYSPEQLIRIVGEDKAEGLPADQSDEAWDDVLKYDIVIDEQPASATEMMETLDYLTRTGEIGQMRERGDITIDDQLELMPIPASIKRGIIKNRGIAQQRDEAVAKAQEAATTVQSLYQFLNSAGQEELLTQFVQMRQNQEFSQAAFSQAGVPQAQPAEQMAA